MYAFCLFLSFVATALGVFAIGFGIPNHDFSVGSTLIISGATGVAAGIVMFGIATAVRQLRRIADTLAPRVTPATRRAAEAVEAGSMQRPVPAQAPAARVPYPPRPGADQREVRAADQREARFERPPGPPQLPVEVPEPPVPRDRPRVPFSGAPRVGGEPPLMEEHEEVSLAPSRALAAQMRSAPPVPEPPPPPEPARPAEPRPSQADIMARLSNLAAAPSRPATRPEPPRAPPPPPVAERPPAPPAAEHSAGPADPRRPNMFDALWPAEVRAARQSQSETIARAPRPEPRPESKGEPRMDPRPEPRADMRSDPRLEPKPDARPEPRGGPPMPPPMSPPMSPPMPREPAPRGPTPPPPAQPRTIAILKSGVIDGMAYTLYTDGSIEAELPQGTMRFASIDDLRSHLENIDRSA